MPPNRFNSVDPIRTPIVKFSSLKVAAKESALDLVRAVKFSDYLGHHDGCSEEEKVVLEEHKSSHSSSSESASCSLPLENQELVAKYKNE